MWTGFWKLTAMVGVVGVGLLAAVHAQKGKDFTFPGSSASVANSEASDDPDESTSEKLRTDEPDEISSLPAVSLASTARTQQEKSRDGVDELTDKASKKSTSNRPESESADDRSQSLIVPVNRRTTSKFDEDASSDNERQEESNNLSVKTASTPAAEEFDELPVNMKNAAATDVEPEPSELASDEAEPLGELEPLVTNETDSKSPSAQTPELIEPERTGLTVGKEELDLPPPPRSKRALKNLDENRDQDQPAESEQGETTDRTRQTEPVDESLNAEKSEPVESRKNKAALEELPEPILDEPTKLEPQEVTRDLPARVPEESNPRRQPPAKKVRPSPAGLPIDLDEPLPSRSPKRNLDPLLQRTGREVEPTDILGDGVAGDASQSGVQQPRITIEKVSQQQAILGQPLIYSIIIRNIGSVDAHNIVIEDRIPKGTKLEGTSPQAELSGKRLVWNQPLLKPNEEKKISIKVIPQQEGPIGSVARVHFATEVSTEIVVAAPQLELTVVNAPREVRIGQRFDLVYSLKNVGTVDANDILLRDILPAELVHEKGDDIECPIGRLVPNEAREIVLSVSAEKTGSVVNKAVLYMDLDPNPKKTLESPIDIVGEVLVLTRDGQDRVYVERPVTFKNNIRNDGNQRADKIKLAETVPAGMEFATASDGGRFDANLRSVVWSIGPLAPGSDKTVTVKYVPQKTGTFDAKITATGSAGSSAAVKSTIDVVGKPELLMETLSATGSVTLGDRITSRFQLKNTGTAAANDVQLRIRLPRQLRLHSVRGAKYQQENDLVIFESIDEFVPKSTAAYELVLEATDEGDAQITLDIYARHLPKPGHRVEMIQIAKDALK